MFGPIFVKTTSLSNSLPICTCWQCHYVEWSHPPPPPPTPAHVFWNNSVKVGILRIESSLELSNKVFFCQTVTSSVNSCYPVSSISIQISIGSQLSALTQRDCIPRLTADGDAEEHGGTEHGWEQMITRQHTRQQHPQGLLCAILRRNSSLKPFLCCLSWWLILVLWWDGISWTQASLELHMELRMTLNIDPFFSLYFPSIKYS